nr:unnamed protein product [Callosobruchus chinensis]
MKAADILKLNLEESSIPLEMPQRSKRPRCRICPPNKDRKTSNIGGLFLEIEDDYVSLTLIALIQLANYFLELQRYESPTQHNKDSNNQHYLASMGLNLSERQEVEFVAGPVTMFSFLRFSSIITSSLATLSEGCCSSEQGQPQANTRPTFSVMSLSDKFTNGGRVDAS